MRSSGIKTLVTVRLFAGSGIVQRLWDFTSVDYRESGIKDFLEDLNPQLLGTIQSEFEKVEGQSTPVPTRGSADLAATSSNVNSGAANPSVDPLDDLFPRVELDRLLVGTSILIDAKSDSWKNRKEALETLQGILDIGQNKRLKPTMGIVHYLFSPCRGS